MADAAVTIRRSVVDDRNVLVATGHFDALFRAWRQHAERWELGVDGLGEVLMHQGLAGGALQLSFRVPEESTAWTLNLRRPAANVFVTGGGHDTITGRYYAEGVADAGISRLFVQRIHPQKQPHRSVLEVEGLDFLAIYEQFFRESEQNPARLVEHGPAHYSMVLGLPGADPEWIEDLDATAIAGLLEEASPLDERRTIFHCGCDPERVAGTLARMFASQADEFFAGEDVVEALCPRCGARHLLDRKTFDRMAGEL